MDFPSGTPADLTALIAAYPLAWLVSGEGAHFHANLLPLLAQTDDEGQVVALVGHCSRRNAQVAALQANPRALVLFMGPQGYVSPGLVSRPGWAPTWNYAVARFEVDVTFDAPGTCEAVRQLTNHMEADQPRPWAIEDAGDRLDSLMARIIGFRAQVVAGGASFKLGQDEDDTALGEIIGGHANPDLAAWMRRLNPGRPG